MVYRNSLPATVSTISLIASKAAKNSITSITDVAPRGTFLTALSQV